MAGGGRSLFLGTFHFPCSEIDRPAEGEIASLGCADLAKCPTNNSRPPIAAVGIPKRVSVMSSSDRDGRSFIG